jgi:hypothetical protein
MSTVESLSPNLLQEAKLVKKETRPDGFHSFTLEYQGKRFMLKEFRDRNDFQSINLAPDELARNLNLLFQIIQKVYPEAITTLYVSQVINGKERVFALQPQIIGQPGDEKDSALLNELQQRWREVFRDPAWKHLDKQVRDFFTVMDFYPDNIIKEPRIGLSRLRGATNVRLIDW